MLVRTLMTANPWTASPNDTLGEVAGLMKREGIRELPVVHGGFLVGIITDRDVKMALGPDARRLVLDDVDPRDLEGSVDWFMTEGAETIDANAQASEAAQLLLEMGVGALPVVDDAELVGILSVTDLLRASMPYFDSVAD